VKAPSKKTQVSAVKKRTRFSGSLTKGISEKATKSFKKLLKAIKVTTCNQIRVTSHSCTTDEMYDQKRLSEILQGCKNRTQTCDCCPGLTNRLQVNPHHCSSNPHCHMHPVVPSNECQRHHFCPGTQNNRCRSLSPKIP